MTDPTTERQGEDSVDAPHGTGADSENPPGAETPGAEADTTPGAAVRPRGVRRRRSAGQVVRASIVSLVVLTATGALAYDGAGSFTAGALEVPMGEVVALDAQSAIQVCPAPVSLPAGAGSSSDTFSSTPVQTTRLLHVAAFGVGTTTTVTPLTPMDAEAPETSATATPSDRDAPTSPSDAASPSSAPPVTGSTVPVDPPTDRADDTAPVAVVVGAATVAVEAVPSEDTGHTLRSVVTGVGGSATGSAAFVTTAGDLRGLAAASCQAPGTVQWLVGGSTDLGTSTRLVMQNSTRTPATVTVTVWGPGGELVLAGATTYLVPPGAQVSTLLEGLAAQQRGIVVRAESTGALTTSYLQSNVLKGFTPMGVDLVVAGEAPAMAQVLPGVLVEDSDVGDTDTAVLRLLAPDADATATITVLGKDGQQVLRGAQTTALTAGDVVDVSLAGLPAGAYTITIAADAPVVAGAMVTATGTPDISGTGPTGTPEDRAWIASSHARAGGTRTVAVPADLAATLVVTALPADVAAATDLSTLVPIVYDDLAAATTTAPTTPAPADPTADMSAPDVVAWPTASRGTVEVYGTDGMRLGRQDLTLAEGQTTTIDLRVLAGSSAIGAVRVVPVSAAVAQALVLDWVVVVSTPEVSGALGVLLPFAPAEGRESVLVRRSPMVGLTDN